MSGLPRHLRGPLPKGGRIQRLTGTPIHMLDSLDNDRCDCERPANPATALPRRRHALDISVHVGCHSHFPLRHKSDKPEDTVRSGRTTVYALADDLTVADILLESSNHQKRICRATEGRLDRALILFGTLSRRLNQGRPKLQVRP